MLIDNDGQLFDVGLMVKICQPKSCKGIQEHEKQESIKPFLEIGGTFTDDCVLLVGKAGSGKSTALRQLLCLEAQAAIRGEKLKIPVLLELRYWDTCVETLIYKFLRKHKQRIDIGKIEDLLLDEELLLLVDGLNELPFDEARDKVARFRHDYPETPMIFTTRDLGVGGNLGIEKQLEIQPLTETQMQEFVRKYLPEQGEQMLQQLGYRLQELGETPFILKMLCDVFVGEGEIPKSRGELFRLFHSTVNKLKEEKEAVPVAEGLRIWKAELLQHLAFMMMQPENPQANPTDFRLSIFRTKAETILEDFLKERGVEYPAQKAKEWLEGLLKHCFVEIKPSESGQVLIQFHHHFFQEYYSAEYLLQLLPKLSDVKLKRDYLNLLKWTESIALALDLVEDEVSAVRVVGLALDIDFMLGARLAGEVKKKFQEKTVELILRLEVPHRLKIELLGITRSEQARLQLRQEWNNALDYGDFDNVHHLAEALSCVGDDEPMFKLWELEKEHDSKMNQHLTADDWDKFYVCQDIYSELEKTESSDVAVLKIVKLLNDKQLLNKGSDKYLKARNYQAKKMLGEREYNQCISLLLQSLNNKDFRVRYYAASALENIGSDAEIRYVTKALEDEKYFVCSNFSEALGKFGTDTDTVITHLIKKLTEEPKFPSFRVAEVLNKFLSDELIDGLIQGLKHKSNVVRSRAIKALGKMNYEKGLKYLLEALNDESSNVRLSAINALVDFGKVNYNSESLIEAIASALKDEESSVRLSAISKSARKNQTM
jgi:energy-coupling factor transporter ATP-binding protein EcfA2